MTNHAASFTRVLSSTLALIAIASLGCDEAPPPPSAPTEVRKWIAYPPAEQLDAAAQALDAAEAPAPSASPPPALAALGAACGDGAACASGSCADGVCCDIACTGTCLACNLDGLVGLCSPVKNAADPGTCDGPQLCGPDRRCGKPTREACASDAECAGGACRTYFLDEDGDGYGTAPLSRCDEESDPPPGYVAKGGDCCDADAKVHPGQDAFFFTKSACGSFDYDCDGAQEPANPVCQLGCGMPCLHSSTAPVPPETCR